MTSLILFCLDRPGSAKVPTTRPSTAPVRTPIRPKSTVPSHRVSRPTNSTKMDAKSTTSKATKGNGLSKGATAGTVAKKPTASLPRPSSSLGTTSSRKTSKTETKNKTIADDRWSRLATPKNVTQKAQSAKKLVKPVISRPQTAKRAPKTTKSEQKSTKKEPAESKTPKEATRPKIETTLAQKSCPRELKEKKRRRTRFSVNTEELKQNLNEWRETDQGKLAQNPQRLWGSLSEQDSMSSTASEVLKVISYFSSGF